MDKLRETMLEHLQGDHTVDLLGLFHVSRSVVVTWLIMAALVLAAVLMTRSLKLVPSRPQLVLEMLVGYLNGFCKENLGHYWRPFAPFLGTMALYIACANLVGLVGLDPPTRDLSVTAALALMSTCLIYGASFYYKGVRGGLRSFIQPMPLLLPINIMEIAIRPLSLCMRLFGNILGGYVIMEMIKCVAPALVPIPFSLYFDVFDGLIQMAVFVFLTTLFTAEALEE